MFICFSRFTYLSERVKLSERQNFSICRLTSEMAAPAEAGSPELHLGLPGVAGGEGDWGVCCLLVPLRCSIETESEVSSWVSNLSSYGMLALQTGA